MDAESRNVTVHEEPVEDLSRYLEIPSQFEAKSVLDVHENHEGLSFVERRIPKPFRKDYDSIENPERWIQEFDVSRWAMFSAYRAGEHVGGAIAAFQSVGVDLLEGRDDLVVVWDIRVAPTATRTGVGSALLADVEGWARNRHCCELKVETQNTNVAACKFYRNSGFSLVEANHGMYLDLPEEIQFIWRKRVAI